jgi:hypothetical protein
MAACLPLCRENSADAFTMLGQKLFLAAHESSTAALSILAKQGELHACRRQLVRAAWCYALDTRLRTARFSGQTAVPVYGRGAPLHLAMGHLCAIVGLRDDAVLMAKQTVFSDQAAVIEEIDAEPEITACTHGLVQMIAGQSWMTPPSSKLLAGVYDPLFRAIAEGDERAIDFPQMLTDRLDFSAEAWGNERGDPWFFSNALAAFLPLEIFSLLTVAGMSLAGAPIGMPCADVLRVDAWPSLSEDAALDAMVTEVAPFLAKASRAI